jgi:hypothetical protein
MRIFGICFLFSLLVASAHAIVVIEDFDSFTPSSVYGSFDDTDPEYSTTLTPGLTSFNIQTADAGAPSVMFGGLYKFVQSGPGLDLSGETDLELDYSLNSSDFNANFIIILEDGTNATNNFSTGYNVASGSSGTLSLSLSAATIDLSDVIAFNFQIDGGEIDLDLQELRAVPEPSSFTLIGLAGAALYLLRRRR